jgi:hypothetical protein
VELAFLDTGCGVVHSLSRNPHLNIESDSHALELSLMPGISGVAYKGSRKQRHDAWANSGYGLYMTSRLCRNGGSFFICSGGAGLLLEGDKKTYFKPSFSGTAIRLILRTDQLGRLTDMLSQLRRESTQIRRDLGGVPLTPSVASQMLSRDFGHSPTTRND